MTPFESSEVALKFESYPPNARRALLSLRELIFSVGRKTPGASEIEETLKWGEPAYLTKNGAGSTIRIDWKPKHPEQYAIYFNCKTTLVESFRTLFPEEFTFVGNRALVFKLGSQPPRDALSFCIAASLTYHAKKCHHAQRCA